MMDTAEKFWTLKAEYPAFSDIGERRWHELVWLQSHLKGCTSLIDIGCGDGAMLNILQHLGDMKLYGCDFATLLMQGVAKGIRTFRYDCRRPGQTELPMTDAAMLSGVIQYVIDDHVLIELFKAIPAPKLFVRTGCMAEGGDRYINGYSDQLKADYESKYRSLVTTMALMRQAGWYINEYDLLYPPELESRYGHLVFKFVLTRMKQEKR